MFKNLIQGVQSPSWRLPRLAGERCPTWLTSGAGSVILLNGQPGDPIVSLHHIKEPAAEVGPFKVLHEQARSMGCDMTYPMPTRTV